MNRIDDIQTIMRDAIDIRYEAIHTDGTLPCSLSLSKDIHEVSIMIQADCDRICLTSLLQSILDEVYEDKKVYLNLSNNIPIRISLHDTASEKYLSDSKDKQASACFIYYIIYKFLSYEAYCIMREKLYNHSVISKVQLNSFKHEKMYTNAIAFLKRLNKESHDRLDMIKSNIRIGANPHGSIRLSDIIDCEKIIYSGKIPPYISEIIVSAKETTYEENISKKIISIAKQDFSEELFKIHQIEDSINYIESRMPPSILHFLRKENLYTPKETETSKETSFKIYEFQIGKDYDK